MNLVRILVGNGAMKQSDVPRLQEAIASAPNKPLHSVIIEKNFAKEEDVLPVLAEQFGMDLVDLTNATVDPETLRIMPTKLVHRRNLMPLSRNNRSEERRVGKECRL